MMVQLKEAGLLHFLQQECSVWLRVSFGFLCATHLARAWYRCRNSIVVHINLLQLQCNQGNQAQCSEIHFPTAHPPPNSPPPAYPNYARHLQALLLVFLDLCHRLVHLLHVAWHLCANQDKILFGTFFPLVEKVVLEHHSTSVHRAKPWRGGW